MVARVSLHVPYMLHGRRTSWPSCAKSHVRSSLAMRNRLPGWPRHCHAQPAGHPVKAVLRWFLLVAQWVREQINVRQ